MILYFSGNGNTRHAAKTLAKALDEKAYAINRLNPSTIAFEGGSFGVMFPVYSWGVPPIVADFISSLSQEFVNGLRNHAIPVWSCCTCGDETGMAHEMMRRIFDKRGMEMLGIWSVIMPNTYVLLPGFDVDSKEVEVRKLTEAEKRLAHIAAKIAAADWETDVTIGSLPRLKSRLIYPLFKKYGIFTSKWHHTDDCIHCGICAERCPVGNITMQESGPVWGKNCTSCLACYNYCPVHAIAYGKATERKHQYHYPDKQPDNPRDKE